MIAPTAHIRQHETSWTSVAFFNLPCWLHIDCPERLPYVRLSRNEYECERRESIDRGAVVISPETLSRTRRLFSTTLRLLSFALLPLTRHSGLRLDRGAVSAKNDLMRIMDVFLWLHMTWQHLLERRECTEKQTSCPKLSPSFSHTHDLFLSMPLI